jgi:hypothetical protein
MRLPLVFSGSFFTTVATIFAPEFAPKVVLVLLGETAVAPVAVLVKGFEPDKLSAEVLGAAMHVYVCTYMCMFVHVFVFLLCCVCV